MDKTAQISVLIIEDDPSWQLIYEDMFLDLENADYSVTIADSSREAIARLEQTNFDVAIIDLKLPEESGGEESFEHGLAVIDHISKLEPRPRALVSTGYATFPVDVTRIIERVDLEVFQKSESENLLESVRRLVTSKGVEEELWKVGGKLSSVAVDLDGVLKVMLERTKSLTGARVGHVLFPVGDDELRIIVGTGEEHEGFPVPMERSITGKAFQMCRCVNVPNVKEEELYFPVLGDGMESELAVPIVERQRAIGVLNLESDRLDAFDELHERIAKTVADLIVATLRNEKRKQELEVTDRLLSEVLNSTEVQRSILEIGVKQLEAQTGSLLLCDGEELVVEATYPEGLTDAPQVGARIGLDECVSGFAVTQKRIITVNDVTTEKPYCDVYKSLGKNMKSEIAAPLEVGGEVTGVLNFESPGVAAFTEYDKSLLSALAKQAAIALEKTRLYEDLEVAKRREKMAAIGELSGSLVHRMNNPLSAIKSNVDLIQLDCEREIAGSSYLREKLSEIERITKKALDMVRQMREKARRIVLKPVDIVRLLQFALAKTEFPVNIAIEDRSGKHDPLPPVLASDQLAEVFRNFFTNAIGAMPRGGKLTIDVYHQVSEDWIVVTVQDTGIGIPEEWCEEIFNVLSVFSQTGELRGQGLGLWYSRAYVEACGGQLPPPDSEIGKGTTFTVRLPVFRG